MKYPSLSMRAHQPPFPEKTLTRLKLFSFFFLNSDAINLAVGQLTKLFRYLADQMTGEFQQYKCRSVFGNNGFAFGYELHVSAARLDDYL
jgi:hypothetical protein